MKKVFILIFLLMVLIILCNCNTTNTPVSYDINRITINYDDKSVDLKSDECADWETVLTGKILQDNPSCGFSDKYSLTVYDKEQTISFCFAMDGCPKLKIGNTDRYLCISEQNNVILHSLLENYGIVFPLI